MRTDLTEAVVAAARGVDLRGKVVLLTGATGRVGRPLAALLARRGASLALCARSAGDLRRLAVTLPYGNVYAAVCDVRSEASVAKFVAGTVRRFGRIDVLINNAAVRGRRAAFGRLSAAAWRDVIDTNVTGAFLMAGAVLPVMRRRGGGAVINVTSGAARKPEPGWAAYSVSKAALEGLTRQLAAEWGGKGIRAGTLDPCTVWAGRRELPAELASAFLYMAGGEGGSGQSLGLMESFAPGARRASGFSVVRFEGAA